MLADRSELSAEQAAMVRAVCASAAFLQSVASRPGSGKTCATEAVAAHVTAGVAIIGCSVSATAAMELERQAGFRRSTGIARPDRDLLFTGTRHDYHVVCASRHYRLEGHTDMAARRGPPR